MVKKIISNNEFIRRAKNGDEKAKQEFFTKNDRLCHHIANRWSMCGLDKDELLSTTRLALIKAYKSFDPDKGFQFATFAVRCMENEILMALRREKKHMNVSSYSNIAMLDADGEEATFEELMGYEDLGFEEIGTKEVISNVIMEFEQIATKHQIDVLRYRFLNERNITQQEVARMKGMSQSWIARVEKQVIDRLQKLALKHGVTPVKEKRRENKRTKTDERSYLHT